MNSFYVENEIKVFILISSTCSNALTTMPLAQDDAKQLCSNISSVSKKIKNGCSLATFYMSKFNVVNIVLTSQLPNFFAPIRSKKKIISTKKHHH